MRYTSCFIGVPLPDNYQHQFEELVDKLSLSFSGIKPVQISTPHITLYYLDEQSQDNLHEIAKIVKNIVAKLTPEDIVVGGFGVFTPENPKVIYLGIKARPSLIALNKLFRERLASYSATDNDFPFQPHLTLARIVDDNARSNWQQNENQIRETVGKESWRFPINEIAIYGVDSTLQPEHQEKLVSFCVRR